MSRIGAVVVSWNGGEALERCLASIVGQGVSPLVIVDNGSRRTEVERLQKLYAGLPEIQCIFLGENRGFAEGANVGLQIAWEQGASVVAVVTQDVVVEIGALQVLAAAVQHDVGIVGPLVHDSRSGAEISRGERVVLPLICFPRSLLRYRGGSDEAYDVSGVMGCLMLITAECARAVGGFDASFFAYYEEVDLCLRARRAGFRIRCVPRARVTHDGMRGFFGGLTPMAAELKARNLLWLMWKHGDAISWATFVPMYSLLLVCSAALYLVRGRIAIATALWRGAALGLVSRPLPVGVGG